MHKAANIIELEEVDSTNNYALNLLNNTRPPEGTVISCINQTKGRGTDSNHWESEAGENLTLSFIYYPGFLNAAEQFKLNQAISISISETVFSITGTPHVTIKWPNDIYIGDKKVAGILIQNSIMGSHIDYAVIGIGMNVNQKVFKSNAPNPVSLSMVTGCNYELDAIRLKMITIVDKYYQMLKFGETQSLNKIYLEKMYRIGQWHYFLIKGIKVNAMIKGITNFGQLQLEGSDGISWICDLKDIKYIL
jgi:BirA family biotin operon repressor/biotin-[acetyl-CoA-carboxylase] ligase